MSLGSILIVDDDANVRLTLERILKRNGYNILLAADAISAISQARHHLPNLVILDLGLHTAGDGFEVMSRLKTLSTLAGIPVVVVSGQDRSLVERKVLASGARAFFQKPIDIGMFLSIIRLLISGSRPVEQWSSSLDSVDNHNTPDLY